MNQVNVPPPVKKHGQWWIRPLPPHWDDWIGGYGSFDEAESSRAGMERTINNVQWQMMLVEMVDEFEEEWKTRRLSKGTRK